MGLKKSAAWHPLETAPKDGTEPIVWVSSQKGFQNTTATFYVAEGQWCWADTEDVLKRPDLVNGWMRYPQPPTLAWKASPFAIRVIKPAIFVDFIGQGSKRQFMPYHRDYHQKLAPKRQ